MKLRKKHGWTGDLGLLSSVLGLVGGGGCLGESLLREKQTENNKNTDEDETSARQNKEKQVCGQLGIQVGRFSHEIRVMSGAHT